MADTIQQKRCRRKALKLGYQVKTSRVKDDRAVDYQQLSLVDGNNYIVEQYSNWNDLEDNLNDEWNKHED